MITFDHVTKVYEGKDRPVKALDDVDLQVEKGEIYGVIGFSGAGKSSLIRCVNLLERPTSGKVMVDGNDLLSLSAKELREAKRDIGMIFQHFNLLNSKTVYTNVAMPLLVAKVAKEEVKKRVMDLLTFVGLEDKANSYPEQLSGGQKQRVGIARALATKPKVLLCDEATSALDPETTKAILQLLKQVNQEYGVTILMITHEMNAIREICDKVAVLDKGKIVEAGSVFDVFSKPKTAVTAKFVRSVMHDTIPDSVYSLLNNQTAGRHIYRIVFVGNSAGKPLLSQIAKTYAVDVNILFGNITELQGVPLGNLIVQFSGDEKEIKRAMMYIHQQKITVKEVLANVS
ncbi:methionine import ATP-binding protein MetN 1 [Virgibacillus pantothenticus]|uniref:Phosphate ABC transporter ATP-binding protein n=1 Tax=Virgibacillus pantothenticus TaxID=1473 RepID=A0A0L0QRD0_VIRPA|nr:MULTISPECIES: methionine ABC transporter ATP-binding protein [Virgibacillus]API92238.1 phosphate ABC transporter ATP-binding protein [Virgibacillus sp. 6R]KNE21154.1 phosphate ABC transporter ATP-binding protein [Virgibacillus pantothenticus]MBS7427164.1 methionine ABC transporter ATP-binding protein [Virgibacillus sp. 19R1-5]MBU8567478.1 methionine ABC transporter ATP-binding protein [Virgibacillus pantothenticus]MBU8601160.1 methionine ABC transporter ATP-binding protein [Virgibacillus pa